MPLSRIRLVLGPGGSGKTRDCIRSIQRELVRDPDGPPLLCLTPRQSTFQIEERILKDPGPDGLRGYTRLRVLDFSGLAEEILEASAPRRSQVLGREGRRLVLHSIIRRHMDEFTFFRPGAHLSSLSARMDPLLRELEPYREEMETLRRRSSGPLARKLEDLERLSALYGRWLIEHDFRDPELFLSQAARSLDSLSGREGIWAPEAVWMDGFARLAPRESALLRAVIRRCRSATLYFCLDRDREERQACALLDFWSRLETDFRICREALESRSDTLVETVRLPRRPESCRWRTSPQLRHMERHWLLPVPYRSPGPMDIRITACPDRHAETEHAARSILAEVRQGRLRFRDIAVVVRRLEDYASEIRSVFGRLSIPHYFDERIPARHHPAILLTLGALRLVVHGWRNRDWFSILKTGLAGIPPRLAWRLEIDALTRGIEGTRWTDASLARTEGRMERLTRPFIDLGEALGHRDGSLHEVDGRAIGMAIAGFWERLRLERRLERWSLSSGNPMHKTLWKELVGWLEDVRQALPGKAHTLADLLAPLEEGLSSLTVGVIPPTVDSVLVGDVDHTRTHEIRHAHVLGVNASVFPAQPETGSLFTETDREELQQAGIGSFPTARQSLTDEQYLAYIACTRPSSRLHLSFALQDEKSRPMTPSSLIGHLLHLFPDLEVGSCSPAPAPAPATAPPEPALLPALAHLLHLDRENRISTSVSRLEEYAQCPFRFFVRSGLGIREPRRHELSSTEVGSFLHLVLCEFHTRVRAGGRRWRDLHPLEAQSLMAAIVDLKAGEFHHGIFGRSARESFDLESIRTLLQDFIRVHIAWMARGGYRFDPAAAELPFGGERAELDPWLLELEEGVHLAVSGKIDRIDLLPEGEAVLIDYKSGRRRPRRSLVEAGIDLQMFTYLNVLENHPGIARHLGTGTLRSAAAFLAPVRGCARNSPRNRDQAIEEGQGSRLYQFEGFFARDSFSSLEGEPEEEDAIHLIPYRLTSTGKLHGSSRNHMDRDTFQGLIEKTRERLREMGRSILSGRIGVDPYERDSCRDCSYSSICRIVPETHEFRKERET